MVLGLRTQATTLSPGNTCIRGTGLSTDYTASQHTIQLNGNSNNYNLISNNNCMGKAVTNGGGTGNSVYGNKYDSGDYKDFTQDEKNKINQVIATGANNYAHPTFRRCNFGSDGAQTISNNVVDNTKLAQVAVNIIKGRKTAGTGNVEDLTVSDVLAMLDVYTQTEADNLLANKAPLSSPEFTGYS